MSGPASARSTAARIEPTSDREARLARLGFRAVAGLDEAGRGSWAGPVVASAVVLPKPSRALRRALQDVRDSKQLSPAERERLAAIVRSVAEGVGVGVVQAPVVDGLGLAAAGRLAFRRAAEALTGPPDFLLIDAFPLPDLRCPQESIIKGDAYCLSIAAASVIAKVERDHLLDELDRQFRGYGFDRNKGYGTPEHARALAEQGPCAEHRHSYAPIRAIVERV